METHTDTAVADAEPTATPEPPLSFTDALEQALNPEATPEPEKVTEEPAAEVQDTGTTKEEPAAEGETTEDPIEALSDDVGDDWTPKAASRFKQLKNELKSNRSEVDQLRQTMKEQEAKMKEMSGLVDGQDFDTLKARVAEYEQDKLVNDLESTAAYKDTVSTPIENLMSQVEDMASKYDIDNDLLIDALAEGDTSKQDAQLEDLLSSVTDRDKARIYRVIEDLNPIMERRKELYANADAALKEAQLLDEKQQNESLAEKAEQRVNVTRNVVKRVTEKLPFLNGFENLNLTGIEEKAAGLDPSVIHPVDFAYNSVAAQLLPTIIREYLGAIKEAETLTGKLAEYEGAEPTMSGAPATEGGSAVGSDKSFVDAIEAALGG